MITSEFSMVARRCATANDVRPCIKLPSAFWTTRSDSVSRALVASSRSRTLGSLSIARQIATRCFCPPDKFDPRAPTCASQPLSALMKFKCAIALQSSRRASDTSFDP
mmetsp:Transcript_50385/g.133844  ORF Transcript_50385/g.133844 Transcript_50385/m.133844 type:complete len:108 (+) Transcript_50385:709-1032(+)